MAQYEASVRLSHISTSSKARNGLSKTDAVATAKAHLRYITRDDAAEPGNVIAWADGGLVLGDTDQLKERARAAIDQRAEKHNDAYGVRLNDKLMVSLPNDAPITEQRQMVTDILSEFCGDSSAFGMAAIHTDKEGNKHAHFSFVDGPESLEAAKARRPDAKRVRRADHLRLNEGGNRQYVRHRVANCINEIARFNGRRIAEVRSFADRGIEREPQKHEGPQVADKLARDETLTKGVFARLKANAIKFRKKLERETIEGASMRLDDVPSRYKTGWLNDTWKGWLKAKNKIRTAGQDTKMTETVEAQTADFVADWHTQTPETAKEPVSRPSPPKPVQDPLKALERRQQALDAVRRANDERNAAHSLQRKKRRKPQPER